MAPRPRPAWCAAAGPAALLLGFALVAQGCSAGATESPVGSARALSPAPVASLR